MTTRFVCCAVILTAVLGPAALVSAQDSPEPLAEPFNVAAHVAAEEEVQALTRGPVHEAFAEPVNNNPAPAPAVAKQPPEPIEELPPEARPDDPNVQWISGYWIWDEDRDDFVWVSGIWRVPPGGLRWVPGYWNPAGGGFQRVGGFWTRVAEKEVLYLPSPPQSVEAGPNVPAPSADHFWIPGYWVWEGGRYLWRSGYWAPVQEEYIWVPAHYVWTPRGCVFVYGYWDYQLVHRGVIFAPVYFEPAVYLRPSFVYAPSVIINVQFLTSHFFVRPTYCHYYFGDYYANRYTGIGIQPWFAFQRTRGWHDPLFVHQRWQHSRNGHDWLDHQRTNYQFFALHEELRPRHTFSDQRKFVQQLETQQKVTKNVVQQVALGTSMREALAGEAKLPQRLERMPDAQRRQVHDDAGQLRELSRQRVQTESKATAKESPSKPGTEARGLERMRLPELMGRGAKASRNAAQSPEAIDRTPGRADPASDPDRNKTPLTGAERQPNRTPATSSTPAAPRTLERESNLSDRRTPTNTENPPRTNPSTRQPDLLKRPQQDANRFSPAAPQVRTDPSSPSLRGPEAAPRSEAQRPMPQVGPRASTPSQGRAPGGVKGSQERGNGKKK